jgi:glycosyltransferase involved in cell wall biosynthesis
MNTKKESNSFKVYCICAGLGFPKGIASTKRIMLIGRALLSQGIPFYIWNIGPSYRSENKSKKGVTDGLIWEYLSPSTQRPKNKILRLFFYYFGGIKLIFKLFKIRKHSCVYLFATGELVDLWVLCFCKLMKIPVVHECCEWWPGTSRESIFNYWMYNHVIFKLSAGALPISKLIEEKITDLMGENYPQLRLPILVDSKEVIAEKYTESSIINSDKKYLFWCGDIDGYKRDPKFLIEVMGKLNRQNYQNVYLVLAGPCSDISQKELEADVSKEGIAADRVIITGYISETELFRIATHACIGLLPLWDDERSQTRFPTKLSLYAAAELPVITCNIGEITQYLSDNQNVIFAQPKDKNIWAKSITRLLNDDILRLNISERFKTEFLPRIEYQKLAPEIKTWFKNIME